MTATAMVSPFPVQRQAPAGWTYIDYPNASLIIQATTKWEKGFRAQACQKEPWTVNWIEAMSAGSVFWNIGANVGSYCLIAASRGIYTVAIEPGYASYAALANNTLANRLEHLITPLCVAVGDGSGIIPLAYRTTEAGAASHAFGVQSAPKSVGTLATLTITLDALVSLGLPAPTHMLIDVDGTEPSVLAGAPGLISEHAPSIMIEVQAGMEQAITGQLASWGYTERQRFDQRGGQLMQGVHYAEYRRD